MLKTITNLVKLVRHPAPEVGRTPHVVVHSENKWRLLRFSAPSGRTPTHRLPLVLVPSMINRWYVLDLLPGKSLVEWLAEKGWDVYVVDWGTPGPEDRHLSFDDVVGRYLGRALRRASETSHAPAAHVLGYCMGGTLAAIHASAFPERVASLTTLAAPVAFADDGILATWTRSPAFDPDSLVDAFGNVPWPLLQASFLMLRPTLTPSKLAFLADKLITGRGFDGNFLDSFLAKEKWANDNVDLPGEVFRTWVRALYREDQLVNGRFTLLGKPARLEGITMPLHVLSFEHDYIVPKESAVPLAERAGSRDITHTHLPGGHVAAVVSESAKDRLWPKLETWWAARDRALRAVSAAE
ncbi:MAG: alpha/beta fold hydrolase [Sandaracinus sp.]|nr:alpha/beta fold hydrolase [Sandaracinus sp.]MCB9625217.1 alpha/beta fold hydrolase [Sandaracinus sp.]